MEIAQSNLILKRTKYLLPPNIIVCDKYKCYKNMMEELGYYGFKYQKKPKSKQ